MTGRSRTFFVVLVSLAVGLGVGALLFRPRPLAPVARPETRSQEKPAASGEPQTLQLSTAQLQQAGIVVKPVTLRAANEIVDAGGVVEIDPGRSTKIASRTAGRLLALNATIGQAVSAGQTIAVIDSPDVADRRARMRAAVARVNVAERRLARERQVASASTQTVGPVLEARLRRDRARVEADRTRGAWERARKLYPEVVSRRDYDVARSESLAASAELQTAEQALANEQRVSAGRIRVRAETGGALTELETAQADLTAAREALEALGVGDGARGEITVRAPRAGIVATRPVTSGEWVEAGAVLMTVVDLSRVWAQLDVYEQDLKRVAVGQDVQVNTGAYPGQVFKGRVAFIHPSLEQHARTARARVELDNAAGLLRAGMFVKATVIVSHRSNAPSVPHDAVMADGEESYVYVEDAPGHFVRRPIKLGVSQGEWYEVREGLRGGDRIVVTGAFYLKSEQQREQIGEDHD